MEATKPDRLEFISNSFNRTLTNTKTGETISFDPMYKMYGFANDILKSGLTQMIRIRQHPYVNTGFCTLIFTNKQI